MVRGWVAAALAAALVLAGCGSRVAAAVAAAPVAKPPAAVVQPQPPGPLAGRVIVLDPGHGNHTGEHSAAGAWEDDNVLAIAEDTAPLLAAMGATVHLTRTGPDLLGSRNDTDLTARVAMAKAWDADVFVSIHQNYMNGAPGITGMETFWDNPDAKALAKALQSALVAGTGLADRGTDTQPFWVIACNPMPAVLVEGGFLSNAAQAAEISTPAFQAREAHAIASGLRTYLSTPGAQVGAQPLTGENRRMCAMDPVQANRWLAARGH